MKGWLPVVALAAALACQDPRGRVPAPPEAGLVRGIEISWAVLREPGFQASVRWLSENGFDHLRVDLPRDPQRALASLLELSGAAGLGLVVGMPEDASPGDWENLARNIPARRERIWLLLPDDPELAAEALAAVRRIDSDRIVVGGAPAPEDPQSLRGFALGPDLAQASLSIDGVAGAARQQGVPVYCRALGMPATAGGSERNAYYDELIGHLERRGIPWALRDAGGEADVLDDKGYLIPGVMAALGRDRPRF